MIEFPCHDEHSAPEDSKPLLEESRKIFGMVPNLARKMATAPALLEGYLDLTRIFDNTSLTPVERQVVLLTVSRENGCEYCVGAHSVRADMLAAPSQVTDAIRAGQEIPDAKLEALRRFVLQVVRARGWARESKVADFLAAGYSRQQVLEVVLGVGVKTLSNYANHIVETELDPAFGHRAWRAPSEDVAVA